MVRFDYFKKNNLILMKNFVTFLILAVIVIVAIVLLKKPKAETMPANEDMRTEENKDMMNADLDASVEIGGQGDVTPQ